MWYYGIFETLPKYKAILEQGIRAAQNYCSCFECIEWWMIAQAAAVQYTQRTKGNQTWSHAVKNVFIQNCDVSRRHLKYMWPLHRVSALWL